MAAFLFHSCPLIISSFLKWLAFYNHFYVNNYVLLTALKLKWNEEIVKEQTILSKSSRIIFFEEPIQLNWEFYFYSCLCCWQLLWERDVWEVGVRRQVLEDWIKESYIVISTYFQEWKICPWVCNDCVLLTAWRSIRLCYLKLLIDFQALLWNRNRIFK